MSTRNSLPNTPWEERFAGNSETVWRYSGNPIIPRNLIPSSNSVFNNAVVSFKGTCAGVFRCNNKKRGVNIHRGFSADGLNWKLEDNPIEWHFKNLEHAPFEYRYDLRVTWLEDRYYVDNWQSTKIGVISSLTEHGCRVPEDVSVVGFDELRFSAFLTPTRTAVSAPTETVGRIATEQLFSLFDKQYPEDNVTLLSTELIIRRSCGCNT